MGLVLNPLLHSKHKFDFSVFGKGTPLNPKNELLLAHLRGDDDFEEQLVEYHSRAITSRSRRREIGRASCRERV